MATVVHRPSSIVLRKYRHRAGAAVALAKGAGISACEQEIAVVGVLAHHFLAGIDEQTLALTFGDFDESRGDRRVELRTGAPLHLCDDFVQRHSLAVGPVGSHSL